MNAISRNYLLDFIVIIIAVCYSYFYCPAEKDVWDSANVASLMMLSGALWFFFSLFKLGEIYTKFLSIFSALALFIIGYIWHDIGLFSSFWILGIVIIVVSYWITPFLEMGGCGFKRFYAFFVLSGFILLIVGYSLKGFDKPYNSDDSKIWNKPDKISNYLDENCNKIPDCWEESSHANYYRDYSQSVFAIDYDKFKKERPQQYEETMRVLNERALQLKQE